MKLKDKNLNDIFVELKNITETAKKYTLSIVVYTLMALLGSCFGLLTSLVSQSLLDFVTKSGKAGLLKFNSIYSVIGAAVVFTVFKIVFTASNSRISEQIRIKINTDMTAEIFDSFICSKWEYTSLFASGDILNRFNNDISVVAGSVIGLVPSTLVNVFQFGSAFFIICYYDKIMALIALITVPLSLICSRFLFKKMQTYARELKKVNSRLMAFNSDALMNMQNLKSFGLVTVFCTKLRKLQREYINLSLDYNRFSIIVTSIMSFLTQMITYACFGWGVYRLWSGAITIGTLVLFVQLYSMLSSSFSSIIGIVPSVINATAASERLTEIKKLPKDDDINNEESEELLRRSVNEKIAMSLEGVTFRYMGDEQDALTKINFESRSGDFVALTGSSGEGKTTLLRLMLALITPTEGGAEIKFEKGEKINISPATRKFFSYVPQKNLMFSDTLAENLRLVRPDATDEEIVNALKTACAYDFVMQEKDGINCLVGDGGVGFSEGQMQRLSIARAVLRNAPIVLFDESTSALDSETEKQVLKNISEWGKNKICIFTTHRPSVLDFCSKVYRVTDSECTQII